MKKTLVFFVTLTLLITCLSSCITLNINNNNANKDNNNDDNLKQGTLSCSLYTSDNNKDYTSANQIEPIGGSNFKWTPGTVAIQYIKIENTGSLAFEYQLSIEAENDNSLSEVIEIYTQKITDNAHPININDLYLLGYYNDIVNIAEGHLLANETQIICVALKMSDSASDNYSKQSNSYSVKVITSQYTYKEDSFENPN